MNVPQLRFRGSSGEWEKFTLGDIAIVKDGTHDSPKYHAEGYPLVTSKNLLKNGNLDLKNVSFISGNDFFEINKRSKVDVGDILFGMIGTIGNPVRVQSSEFAIKNVALIKESQVPNEYISHYLGSRAIEKQFHLNQAGGTQKFIGLGLIRNLEISLPKEKELQKVTSFFTLINKRINMQKEKIEKLEQFKKGMMQKIFSQELRFKDEDGGEFAEWEEKKLNEISFPVKRTLNEIDYQMPVLTISAGKGFLNQTDRFSQVIAGKSLSKYTLLQKGELAYNRGASKAFPFGCIYSLQTYEEALVPNVYRSFSLLEGYKTSFYEQLFLTGFANRQLRQFVSSSARLDGLLNINQDDFFTLQVPVPPAKEQEIIGKYLNKLDWKIEIEKEKLMVLVEQKRGFMCGMFI